MRRVVQMLKKLSRNCHDFILHCQKSSAVTKEDRESCFDIFLIITTFFADAVQFLRQADDDFSELTHARGGDSISREQRLMIANVGELTLARQAGIIPRGPN